MSEGIVFDIQRFALHDGPGIRSVAFLKGCPLHCLWCCNPESISSGRQLIHKSKLCTQCHTCLHHCHSSALSLQHGRLKIDFTRCDLCGECVGHCPSSAMEIIGRRMDSQTVVEELARDLSYFVASGGGITLSGGEPMMQSDFAMEILKGSKEKGIHTCIETTGFFTEQTCLKIAPCVDLFLLDYKIDDSGLHRFYTGRDNAPVKKMLKILSSINAKLKS